MAGSEDATHRHTVRYVGERSVCVIQEAYGNIIVDMGVDGGGVWQMTWEWR